MKTALNQEFGTMNRERMNIKPIHSGAFHCEQDLIAMVAKWQGLDFEFMFVKNWGFNYRPGNGGLFCDKIDGDLGDEQSELLKYHGIQLVKEEAITAEQILNRVKRELNSGYPVPVLMDTFWCPWDAGFQKLGHDAEHFLVMVGLDLENERFYCVDTIYMKYWEPLPLEFFFKGQRGICGRFVFSEPLVKEIEWRSIILDAVDRLYSKEKFGNAFEAMRCFAGDLAKEFDIAKETQGYRNFLRAKIYRQVFEIARGRKQFAKSLEYLAKKLNLGTLGKLAGELERAGSKWESVRAMLLKMYKMYTREALMGKIAKTIREAADEEERIAQQLLIICRNKELPERIKPGPINQTGSRIQGKKIRDFCGGMELLDLAVYFNNHGCGSSHFENCQADLNGLQEFFLCESMPKKGIFEVAGMKFLFPLLADGINDNISCLSQVIAVKQGQYSRIMFLGCADEGSFSEPVVIFYEGGEVEELYLNLSCWWLYPDYGEMIAWEGRFATRTIDKVHVAPNRGRLYAQDYNLNQNKVVVGIKLPENMNMHLFAISLQMGIH